MRVAGPRPPRGPARRVGVDRLENRCTETPGPGHTRVKGIHHAMKFSPAYPTLALLLLTTVATGCNLLSDKYCIGNCPEEGGSDGTDSLGGSETGLSEPTDSTGTPQDPPPTCDLVDTIVTFDTCMDQTVQPGELCFVIGSGSEESPAGVVSMIAAQLQGPGTDLLIAREGKMVSAMLFAQGQGLSVSSNDWPQPIPFLPGGELHLTVVGDFNEDGIPDVAGRIDGPDHNDIVLFTLDGAGGLLGASVIMDGAGITVGAGVKLVGPDLYDDGDGHLDLLVTMAPEVHPENAAVLHGNGAGNFTIEPAFGWSSVHHLHVTGALGSDGVHNDVVVAGEDSLDILFTHPGGDTLLSVPLEPDIKVQDLSVADLNGDGLGDIVALVVDPLLLTSEIVVATQIAGPDNDAPEFSKVHYTVHCGAVALAIGDLDNDGAPDIVTASTDTPIAPITIRPNDGAGGFAEVLTVEVIGPVDDLSIADLNGDGAADFATASRVAGAIGLAPSVP